MNEEEIRESIQKTKDMLLTPSRMTVAEAKAYNEKLENSEDKKDKRHKVSTEPDVSLIENIDIELENDIRFKGHLAHDLVSDRPVIIGETVWDRPDITATLNDRDHPLFVNRRYMTDFDVENIKRLLQRDYKATPRAAVDEIKQVCKYHAFDAIKERLEYLGSQYDGGEYIRKLLPKYLGVEDDDYQASVQTLHMVAFCERQWYPGAKYDCTEAISGKGGAGKSTFITRCCFNDKEYFTTIIEDVNKKDTQQKSAGFRIIEIAESEALKKSSNESMKDWQSRTSDDYRNPYDRLPEKHKRKCIFFLTCNSDEYLTDITGNRRYLPVEARIDHIDNVKYILDDACQEDFDKAWGEAYCIWKTIRKDTSGWLMELAYDLSKDAEKHQAMHMEQDPIKGLMQAYLEHKIISWSQDIKDVKNTDVVKRPMVCLKELIDRLDMENAKRFDKRALTLYMDNVFTDWKKSKTVQRFPEYGPQGCWIYSGNPIEVNKDDDLSQYKWIKSA